MAEAGFESRYAQAAISDFTGKKQEKSLIHFWMDKTERLFGACFDFGCLTEWCDWFGVQAQARCIQGRFVSRCF